MTRGVGLQGFSAATMSDELVQIHPLMFGAFTDPFHPFETTTLITAQILP